jgi:formamidopyrimidine-DNA glycosylase
MPELPEVEGLRRRVAPLIVGWRLDRLEVRDAKLWRPADGLVAADAQGRRVLRLDRRAKLLLLPLDGGLSLAPSI